MLPCARTAFTQLTRWVENARKPSRDGFYPRPAEGDLVNSCRL
jgi:hypothetical protein